MEGRGITFANICVMKGSRWKIVIKYFWSSSYEKQGTSYLGGENGRAQWLMKEGGKRGF